MNPSASLFLVLLVSVAVLYPIAAGVVARRAGAPRPARAALAAAAAVIGWLGITGWLIRTGRLSDFNSFPPPVAYVLLPSLLLVFLIAFSRPGRALADHLPYWALIGFQVFRFPLELLLARFHAEGLIPVEMTFHGWNFDIVTGLTALPIAAMSYWGRASDGHGHGLRVAWNILGTVLLVVIIGLAVSTLPGSMHAFGGAAQNRLPETWPHGWILLLVLSALLGHLITARKLARSGARSSAT